MTTEFIDNYFEDKLGKEYIVCTVYDLRVVWGVYEEDIDEFLRLSKIKLENRGYQVFFTGTKFTYKGKRQEVEMNNYLVAIKEEENNENL